jgi:hypothetical protein
LKATTSDQIPAAALHGRLFIYILACRNKSQIKEYFQSLPINARELLPNGNAISA